MTMRAFHSPEPGCTMPVCTKSSMGQMILPSTACHCVQDLGPGRVSLPPLVWFVLSLSIALYVWLTRWPEAVLAWKSGAWEGLRDMLADGSNFTLVLTAFSLLLLGGGMYELRKRKQELETRRPLMRCEPHEENVGATARKQKECAFSTERCQDPPA